jgi:hypothetical protein
MKKFFLFKRKDVDVSSVEASDNGEGLDLFAVSADLLAFMTASLGRVNIVFNDATLYEESNLLDGESFKKTSVSVACEAGGEANLIESIMNFVSSDLVKTRVMRFDAVTGKTNVKEANIQSFDDVVSELKTLPVRRTTKETSSKTFIGGTSGTAFGTGNLIGDIDFGEGNKPDIDFTEENITSSGGNVTGWTNGGSLGAAYDIGTIVGTIPLQTGGTKDSGGLATDCAVLDSGDALTLDAPYVRSGEFTLFAVVGKTPAEIEDNPKIGFLFQGSSSVSGNQGLTLGYSDPYKTDAYYFKFATEKGEFVKAATLFPIIDITSPTSDKKTSYVFLLRRDAQNNLFIYDNEQIVASVQAKTTGNSARTDGNLVVRHLGNGNAAEKFVGNVGRFGVIPRDIGASAAKKLITDLSKKYTPLR